MLVQPLDATHDRGGFDCGQPELNAWLRQVAGQHRRKRLSATFVAVAQPMDPEIMGFYALGLSELVNADLPPEKARRLPQRVPVFRLGRLAVALRHRGRRIGEYLLFDAIDRAERTSAEVGGVGLVVDAKPEAIDFYRAYGFEPMADHPANLFLAL